MLRRRLTALGSVAVLLALTVGAAGLSLGSSTASLTPAGWVAVDFGNAQVSVPASWTISSVKCGGAVYLVNRGNDTNACSVRGVSDMVALAAASCAHESSPGCGADAKPFVVNGIDAYRISSENKWVVPRLDLTITLTGPLSSKVFHTVTSSPTVAVLASGRAPAIPSSWHRVSFDGISVAVPASWPSIQIDPTFVGDRGFGESEVILDGGGLWTGIITTEQFPIFQSHSALLIERVAGQVEGKFGPCIHVNGLSACPRTNSINSLALIVDVLHQKQPVGVEISLAGNGIVARTILYSTQAG